MRVLGDVQHCVDNQRIDLGYARQRSVLAALQTTFRWFGCAIPVVVR